MTVELVTSPVICMYCKTEYRRIPSPPSMPGAISHGCCPGCLPIMWQKMGIA